MKEQLSVEKFNEDIEKNGEYQYTNRQKLSTKLALARFKSGTYEAVASLGKPSGTLKMIDVGCGDGYFVDEIQRDLGFQSVVGIDFADKAIEAAQKYRDENVSFQWASAYELPFEDESFDVAMFRGALHHMDQPLEAITEAARVAKAIVIQEPNGYNPVLKVIEKTSRYHIEHGERSYPPMMFTRHLRKLGFNVSHKKYIGIIPVFAPNWFAKFLNAVEPGFERIPIANKLYCSNLIVSAVKGAGATTSSRSSQARVSQAA